MLYQVFSPLRSFGAAVPFPELEVVRNRSGQIRHVETGIRRRAAPLIVREMLDMDVELKVELRQ